MTKEQFGVILGGSIHQEPFIKEVELYGYTPIILDRNTDCFLASSGRKFIECDISSPIKCTAVLTEFNVAGCFTGQSDIGVPAQGMINDTYGLVGVTYEQAEIMSNKLKFRKLLEHHGIFQPQFNAIKSRDDILRLIESCGYPIAIKPVDSSGSRGFSKVTCSAEIDYALRKAMSYTSQTYVLGESFIEGVEFGAQVFSINGIVKLSHLHTDWTIQNIPVGHCMPVKWEVGLENRVQSLISDCINAIGHTGPSNVDLIIDADENVYVLEIGGRVGATCLPELVQMATGDNLFNIQVGITLGVLNESTFETPLTDICGSGVRVLTSNKNIHSQLSQNQLLPFIDDLKSKFNLYDLRIETDISDIRKLQSGVDRFGKILYKGFVGEDPYKIEDRLEYINANICDHLLKNE